MSSRRFTLDEIRDYLDEVEYEEHIDTRRWSSVWRRIFKADDGNFYEVYEDVPATEYQEGQDRFQTVTVDGVDYIPARQVQAKTEMVPVTTWVGIHDD